MDELMVIDTGHLIGKTGGGFSSEIKDAFSRFQDELREKRNPITLSFLDEETIAELKSTAMKLREKYENILILGIGGSALGTKAMLQFLYGCYYLMEQQKPRLFVLDNIDPATVSQLERIL